MSRLSCSSTKHNPHIFLPVFTSYALARAPHPVEYDVFPMSVDIMFFEGWKEKPVYSIAGLPLTVQISFFPSWKKTDLLISRSGKRARTQIGEAVWQWSPPGLPRQGRWVRSTSPLSPYRGIGQIRKFLRKINDLPKRKEREWVPLPKNIERLQWHFIFSSFSRILFLALEASMRDGDMRMRGHLVMPWARSYLSLARLWAICLPFYCFLSLVQFSWGRKKEISSRWKVSWVSPS